MPVVADPLIDAGLDPTYARPLGAAITFLVSFLVLYLIGKRIADIMTERVLRGRNIDEHARKPLRRLVKILVFFAAVTAAFGLAGYGNFLTSLATVAAAATLAIGFAMQDVIANFVSGVFIYTDRPFRIGDWIEWDDNAGIVEDISLRVTRVRTFDNELLTVPNSQLTNGVINNPVANEQLRLKIVFGIGYDDDVDAATDILIEEAESHPEILADPAPSVRLTELGDSSVGLQSRIWIDDPSRADFVKTRSEYVSAVKERFDAEDIEFPYPTRTLEGDLEVTGAQIVADKAED